MDTTTTAAAIAEQEAIGYALAGSVLTTMIVIALIALIVAYFVACLGFFKMFKKAGVPGWKAFVPFINTYEKFKISWNEKKFWGWFAASTVSFLLLYFAEMIAGGSALDFLPDALGVIAGIVALDYSIKMNRFLASAYGKGRVFGACLWVFPFIASLVLGFGKADYIGNQSAK